MKKRKIRGLLGGSFPDLRKENLLLRRGLCMLEYSILETAVQLGARVVDLDTGELITAGRKSAATRPAAGGLSNPHICTNDSEGSVSVWLGGGLLSCKKPAIGNIQVGGGKRGKVTGFSSGSRRRMLYMMGKIERAKMPVMVTLTYPSEYPTEGKVWKDHLRRWWQRLRRRQPGAGAIWKLEPQKRGAPHFHLLIWGVDGWMLHDFRTWASKAWFQVVASGDDKHLRAGVRVEQVRDRRGVMAYAGKYLGKKQTEGEPGWDEPGRYWGVKSADNIPWASMVQCALTTRQTVKLLRLMRRAMHCKRGNLPGLTMLSNNPDYWFDRLDRLVT